MPAVTLTMELKLDTKKIVRAVVLNTDGKPAEPVLPLVWDSGDDAVVTVENEAGTTAELQAQGLGTATVTMTDDDGNEGSITVNVVPNVEPLAVIDHVLIAEVPGSERVSVP